MGNEKTAGNQGSRARRVEATRFEIGGETLAVIAIPATGDHELEELTSAENEVCRAMLAGLSNAAIASERGRSINTIENQIASIFRKLHVSSRSELAVLLRRRAGG